MTDPNKAELRRLAEAAAHKDWYAGNAYDKPFILKYQIITDTPDGKYVLLDGNQNFPDDCVANVAFVGAASPAVILSLLHSEAQAKCEAGQAIHQKDAAYAECKALRAERDAALAELEALRQEKTDWQKECLKKGFEYVRESDDHYVVADPAEMVSLLRDLLGIDVRQKDGGDYGVSVAELEEQIEGLINTIHGLEEFRKDAERYRWLRGKVGVERMFGDFTVFLPSGNYGGVDQGVTDQSIDAAMSQEANHA